MSKDPAFPFYASDWLGSNKRAMMTMEQQSAYVILLCRQWADPTCSLPDDDDVLASLSDMGQGWLDGGCQLVRDCFGPIPGKPGRIGNPRLLEVRAERDEWRRKSSEGGKKSAAMREKQRKEQSKGGSTTLATTLPTNGATKPQPNGNSPSPSSLPSSLASAAPLSSPTPEAKAKPCRSATDRSVEIRQVFDHYRTYHPQAHKRPNCKGKEWKCIKDRLADGYTVDDLKAAIDGCHRSPWNMGENPGGTKYDSLELIMRDSSHVSKYMEVPENAPVLSEASRRSMRAMESFVSKGETK